MSTRTAIVSFSGAVLSGTCALLTACGGAVPSLPGAGDASAGASLEDAAGQGAPPVGHPLPDPSHGSGAPSPDASAADVGAPPFADASIDATRPPASRADAAIDADDHDDVAEPREHVDASKLGPQEAGVDATATCRTGDPSCTSQHECDTESDCDDGNVCCYDFSSVPASTRCRNDCGGGGGMRLQACRTQAECTSGTCSVHACTGQPAIQSCQPREPECP